MNKEQAVEHNPYLERLAEMQFKFYRDAVEMGGVGLLDVYTLAYSQVYYVDTYETFRDLHKKNVGMMFDESHLPKSNTVFFIRHEDNLTTVFLFDRDNEKTVNLSVWYTKEGNFTVLPICFYGEKMPIYARPIHGVGEDTVRLIKESFDEKDINYISNEFFYFCECLYDYEVVPEKIELTPSRYALSALKAKYKASFTPRDVIVLK